MSDVLLTSLLEDKKSFFQVSLTSELLSWVRVVSPEGATGSSGGWGQTQRLKQRESILSSSPSAVATDINSRRTVMTRHLLGVSTSDSYSSGRSKWAKRKSAARSTTASSSVNDAFAVSSSYSDASTSITGVSDATSPKATPSSSSTTTESVDARRNGDFTSKTDSYLNGNSQSNSPTIALHRTGERGIMRT